MAAEATARFVALALLLAASDAPDATAHGDCEDGIPPGTGTCLCDTLDVSPQKLLWCEDFEAPSLYYLPKGVTPANERYEDARVVAGNTSYPYGPWYDNTGLPSDRGFNSYWSKTYDDSPPQCAWPNGEPVSPTYGVACSGGQQCIGMKSWHPENLWSANFDNTSGQPQTCMAIIGDGDFDMEVEGVVDPVLPNLGAGVFDGHFSLGDRLPACPRGGCPREYSRSGGLHGEKNLGGPTTAMGMTMAVAYSSNLLTAGMKIGGASWKHMEWKLPKTRAHDAPLMFQLVGYYNGALSPAQNRNAFPFHTFYKLLQGAHRQGDCAGQLGVASRRAVTAPHRHGSFTLHRGMALCDDKSNGELTVRPAGSDYQFMRDWGVGEWGCVRGEWKNVGLPGMSGKVWFNEKLIVHFSGFDGTVLKVSGKDGGSPGWLAVNFNNFYNANQNAPYGGSDATTEVTYVYYDNIAVTDGAAVSCESIGFSFEE